MIMLDKEDRKLLQEQLTDIIDIEREIGLLSNETKYFLNQSLGMKGLSLDGYIDSQKEFARRITILLGENEKN